jgi:hypothetical protein
MPNQIDALESKYRKYADASTAAILRGDAKTANRNFDKLVAIAPKLKAFGAEGEAVLRRLMKDASDAVATSAAFDCLPFAEAEALEVLDAIARKAGIAALDAKMIAKEWRAGRLRNR